MVEGGFTPPGHKLRLHHPHQLKIPAILMDVRDFWWGKVDSKHNTFCRKSKSHGYCRHLLALLVLEDTAFRCSKLKTGTKVGTVMETITFPFMYNRDTVGILAALAVRSILRGQNRRKRHKTRDFEVKCCLRKSFFVLFSCNFIVPKPVAP